MKLANQPFLIIYTQWEGLKKKSKWILYGYSKSFNHLHFITFLQKKQFLYQIVIGDEKWIYYDNLKHKKSWISPGQPSTLTQQKCNMYGSKILLCIWWDIKGIVYWAAETKSNNHCWALLTTINWFELCFKSEKSNKV